MKKSKYRPKHKNIKNIANLANRLQLLCEGFDNVNKSSLLTTKIKILLYLSKHKRLTPTKIMHYVGLAKSNVTSICNKMQKEGLIKKIRDNFDNREIFYRITPEGKMQLEECLEKMEVNFMREIEYKGNIKTIFKAVEDLLNLVY